MFGVKRAHVNKFVNTFHLINNCQHNARQNDFNIVTITVDMIFQFWCVPYIFSQCIFFGIERF